MALARQGVADLDRGVALKPDAVGTHASRGPALLAYANGLRRFDKAAADRLTATAIGDFEFVAKANATTWDKLAEHDRGEILGALAAGWLQLDDTARAAGYLDRMIKELPGTPYALNASARRADPAAKTPLTCLGCH